MKVFQSDDGEIYQTRKEIPIIHRSDNSERLNELDAQIALNEAKYQELQQEANFQYDYLNKIKEERKVLDNDHDQPIYKPTVEVRMSTLKELSKLGYKHIVMPDVFLRERNYYLDKNIIDGYMNKHNYIIGEIHDKVIIYKRKPIKTSSIYKHKVGRIEGRELKWIAEIKEEGKYSTYYQVYLDKNKIRLGEPGSPMKSDNIKKALSGLFYIDRMLNYNETKQLILAEMVKQLLKGK